MSDVTHLAEALDDPMLIDVRQGLVRALEEFDAGNFRANKALLIFLDDEDGEYSIHERTIQMTGSECVALLESSKHWRLDSWLHSGDRP